MFPLSYFSPPAPDGSDVSRRACCCSCGSLIDRGGQGSSLSGWLQCLLEQKGCVLSRRTVAQVPGGAGHPRHGGRRECNSISYFERNSGGRMAPRCIHLWEWDWITSAAR